MVLIWKPLPPNQNLPSKFETLPTIDRKNPNVGTLNCVEKLFAGSKHAKMRALKLCRSRAAEEAESECCVWHIHNLSLL